MTAGATETRMVAVVRAGEPIPPFDDWTPWRNCRATEPAEYTAAMAVHRFLRVSGYAHRPGGARWGFEPFDLVAYVARPGEPLRADGRPAEAVAVSYWVRPS